MIAPNNNPPGRNEPCPCGSGLKYKQCCRNPKIKALRQDHIRMKVLAHLFLTQIHKLSGSLVVEIPMDGLQHYPTNPEIKMVRDPVRNVILCTAKPPQEQPNVIGPRRILLPR